MSVSEAEVVHYEEQVYSNERENFRRSRNETGSGTHLEKEMNDLNEQSIMKSGDFIIHPIAYNSHEKKKYSSEIEYLMSADIIIAVMGPTGSGKSSFISNLTGDRDAVGHGLESFTEDIIMYRLRLPHIITGDVVLIDTPGFDDTRRKDTDIFEQVSEFLSTTFKRDIYLSGILYLHRISDVRMAGTPLKNLRMFNKLCGTKAFINIVFGTTMWETLDDETIGRDRETELISEYWLGAISQGAKAVRVYHNQDSAQEILIPMLHKAQDKRTLLIQEEIVKQRMSLPETSAGRELCSRLEDLLKRQQNLVRKIRVELGSPYTDGGQLMKEYEELREKIGATAAELQKLRLPLGKRILRFFRFHF